MGRKWTNSKGINTDSDKREYFGLEKLRKEVIENYKKKTKHYPKNKRNKKKR